MDDRETPLQVEGAHTLGVMGVSWAPAVPRGSLTSGKAPGPPARRFATGGCDNTVKVRAPALHACPASVHAPPAQLGLCASALRFERTGRTRWR
jgi:hypothetical protein